MDFLISKLKDIKLAILAPVIIERKGEHLEVFNTIAANGFAKVRVDGVIYDIEEVPSLAKTVKHTVEIVVDRVRSSLKEKQRLIESVETAVKYSEGRVHVLEMAEADKKAKAACFFHCAVLSQMRLCPTRIRA